MTFLITSLAAPLLLAGPLFDLLKFTRFLAEDCVSGVLWAAPRHLKDSRLATVGPCLCFSRGMDLADAAEDAECFAKVTWVAIRSTNNEMIPLCAAGWVMRWTLGWRWTCHRHT